MLPDHHFSNSDLCLQTPLGYYTSIVRHDLNQIQCFMTRLEECCYMVCSAEMQSYMPAELSK